MVGATAPLSPFIFKMANKIIFLDNIRSAHNVGAIFRTADGAGVSKLYLGGYTPTPTDRFGRPQPEIVKTSLGASTSMAWEPVAAGEQAACLRTLQAEGYFVVAVEQTAGAISMYDFTVPSKVVYIFGNEVTGVQPELLAVADSALHIPLHGHKESLNVATTVGIIVFLP